MIKYDTPLELSEIPIVTVMSHKMDLGTLSAIAGYSDNPDENPLACAVGIMLDIEGSGNWNELTIAGYIGLIAQCREGRYYKGQYYDNHGDDMPYLYAMHALAIAMESAAKSSVLLRLFCNISYSDYYRFITSQNSFSIFQGFDHIAVMIEVIGGYANFTRSGYLFWKDDDGYYKNMASVLLGNVYKFLVEPVTRSEDMWVKKYLDPDTALNVVLPQEGEDYGKE